MGTLRVGLSHWGILADFTEHALIKTDTPDGHRYGRPILVRALQDAGHKVIAMQERREPQFFSGVKYACESWPPESRADATIPAQDPRRFPDLDVLFLEWRWPTWKNDRVHPQHIASKYEPDLDRQRELIEFYSDKCPIIAWDTDLKITLEDEERYPGLILADASLETNRLSRDRVSLPFWTDWEELLPTAEPYPIYGYIGNNYERDKEFQWIYFYNSGALRDHGVQTSMYGNWLQTSPERPTPESLIANYPMVNFNHRLNFYDSMAMMNRFICTTHASKPLYYAKKFMSPRYLEALAVNCPALMPLAFGMNLLGRQWTISSSNDIYQKITQLTRLSLADRKGIVEEQRAVLRMRMRSSVSEVVSFIESQV